MAKARAIVKRRKAVRNIRKITQTMQLIATARYQKCLQRALATKPYTAKITEMIQTLAGLASVAHPLLQPNEGVGRSVLLAITSSRGLCGSYNSSVLRLGLEKRKELTDAGVTPSLEMVGKKGVSYFRFLGYELAATITDVDDRIAFRRVAEMAERYMRLYQSQGIARVDVAYMSFHSVAVQRPTVVQLLPIAPPAAAEEQAAAPGVRPQYEFSPPPAELLAKLIPESVSIQLFQCFNDAIVSEQAARMVAMKAATDAAGDMIKYLTQQYNRVRQAQITLELADIVGGAEAVK
jgi:F-type H+-transporting ATPase subunit gamma